jgi:RNA polymerase sigma-70 factor (ECF subfamily)
MNNQTATFSPSKRTEIPQIRDADHALAASPRRMEMKLVADIVAGDGEAFDRLYTLYHDRIFRFAVKRLRDAAEAEDVCQDVFLQIHRCIGSFEGRSSLLTWMFGIAHHQVCRRYRKRSHETLSLDAPEAREVKAEQVSTDREVEAHRIFVLCNRAIDEQLGEVQRKVFQLRYAENYSTKEIAERMGKSNQAIKISLFRSRQTLAASMTDLDVLLSA